MRKTAIGSFVVASATFLAGGMIWHYQTANIHEIFNEQQSLLCSVFPKPAVDWLLEKSRSRAAARRYEIFLKELEAVRKPDSRKQRFATMP